MLQILSLKKERDKILNRQPSSWERVKRLERRSKPVGIEQRASSLYDSATNVPSVVEGEMHRRTNKQNQSNDDDCSRANLATRCSHSSSSAFLISDIHFRD